MAATPQFLAKALTEPWAISEQGLSSIFTRLMEPETAAAIAEPSKPEEPAYRVFNGVAVIPVFGVLDKHVEAWEAKWYGLCDIDSIAFAAMAADDDPAVRQILLYFNSPGGNAVGVPEVGETLTDVATRKRTVAFSDYLCCSGAQWLASQCDASYSSLSAQWGSIGVRCAYADFSRAYEEMGIKVNAFAAGKWKLTGAPFKPMTDEERAMIQGRIERIYTTFTTAVQRGRGPVPKEAMQGQVLDAAEAIEANLVDGLFNSLPAVIAHMTR